MWHVSSSSGRLAVQAARFKCCDRGVRQSWSPGQVISSSRITQGSTGHVNSTGGARGTSFQHGSTGQVTSSCQQLRSLPNLATQGYRHVGGCGVSQPVLVEHQFRSPVASAAKFKRTGHVASSGHVAQGSRGHVSATEEHRASHQFRLPANDAKFVMSRRVQIWGVGGFIL